jgi:hypothetical protein
LAYIPGSIQLPEGFYVTLNTYLDIFLRVTDQDGLMTEATRIIQPSLLSVEIATNPSGLKVLVDEEPVRTSKHPNAIGHEVNMSCISEQMINILCLYVLVRWIYRPGM